MRGVSGAGFVVGALMHVDVDMKEEVLGHLLPPRLQSAVVEVVKNLYQESCFVKNSACLFS